MTVRAKCFPAIGIVLFAAVAFSQQLPSPTRIDSLIGALRDTNALCREHAASALGMVGPAAANAVEALLPLLSDIDPYVVGASTNALARIGSPALPGISRLLSDIHATGRLAAVNALGKMGPEAASLTPALQKALMDSNADIRWSAARALGTIGPQAGDCVPQLLRCLCDSDQDVRAGASYALERIDPSAVRRASSLTAVTSFLDSLLPRIMKEENVPGCSFVLIQHREIVWTKCLGVADKRSGAPVTDSTMFEACSLSKPVFAALVMHLVEEHALCLDRPLSDFVKLSALSGEPESERITARMVLSHTTGLPNWRREGDELDAPLPILFAPGTQFSYSGEGFAYLQKVTEKLTGEPLEEIARQELFRRLGLRHASYQWTKELDPLIAAGHDGAGNFKMKTRYLHPNAAYTLYISALDYARFLCALLSPSEVGSPFLHRASIDSMLAHRVRVIVREPIQRPGKSRGKEVYWALGWGINTSAEGDVIYHTGSNQSGFRCYCQFKPGEGSGIVIMTNGEGGTNVWERIISRIGDF